VCLVGGCTAERTTAVEWIDSGTPDSGGSVTVGDETSSGGRATGDDGAAGDDGNATGGDGAAEEGGAPSSTCKSPAFVTSSPSGIWSDSGYFVFNNMWNTSVPLGPQTLSACSYHNWYVVSNQTSTDGAVKTYPNAQMNFNDVAINSFKTITSRFAETSPHIGIYDVAYDIWTNGIAVSGDTEFMIWNENYNQVPTGSQVATTTLGGRTYDVWKTSNNDYIAFVPTAVFTSGTVDLLEFFTWAMAQGWVASDSTLSQIDFGVEIVSTDGADATFQFTDFSITTN